MMALFVDKARVLNTVNCSKQSEQPLLLPTPSLL